MRAGFSAGNTNRSMRYALGILLMLFFTILPNSYAANTEPEGVAIKNPGSDLWRAVRQRNQTIEGSTQIKGVDSHILINPQADRWTRFRVEGVVKYGAIAIASVVVLIILFYLLRGQVKIAGGLSGKMIHRFSDYERVLHWTLALIFLFLALTGLMMLLGRNWLLPVFGHELFSLIASASKEGHNLFGPIFVVSLLLMLFHFFRKNLYEKGDVNWLLKGGGMIGKSHVSSGFFNMGEKIWYWLLFLVGLAISVSGLILLFPQFGQARIIMELSEMVHVLGALLLIMFSFGHIYLGTVAIEGASESMKSGYVDVNWAEAHHDRWAKYCRENNLVISPQEFAKLQGTSVINQPSSPADAAELNQ